MFMLQASRKISKCSYLFVAPDTFDFKSPLDRTRVSEILTNLAWCLSQLPVYNNISKTLINTNTGI